jgi:hypothetical protein
LLGNPVNDKENNCDKYFMTVLKNDWQYHRQIGIFSPEIFSHFAENFYHLQRLELITMGGIAPL